MNSNIQTDNNDLFVDLKQIVCQSKKKMAQSINQGLTMTYWEVGKRINKDILEFKRAEYGKKTLKVLSDLLTVEYGRGWSVKQLLHCLRIAETFPKIENISAVGRQLGWTQIKTIMYLESELKRDFYMQMSIVERWSTRMLSKKIDSMLFERTALSKKPANLAKLELDKLKNENILSPDLVFKNHYVLDFLNLKDVYQERDLESAILKEIENFILELGVGFTFVARQKRMTIDNVDFYLDLLFYHRKLKCLVAIDLKIGKFKPAYKGQMELYLRWLEINEKEQDEHQPIGLILCQEGNSEQIELLQLDNVNIKVAEYITKYLPKELLVKKLNEFTKTAKNRLENRDIE